MQLGKSTFKFIVLPILNILKGVMSKIRHHDYRSIYRWSSHNEMEMYTRS